MHNTSHIKTPQDDQTVNGASVKNHPIRRWMGGLVLSCTISAALGLFALLFDSEIALLLTLMNLLISSIIALRIYWLDVFLLQHQEKSPNSDYAPQNLGRLLSTSPDLYWRIHYASREVHNLNNNYLDTHPISTAKNSRITNLLPVRVARQYLEALIEVQIQGTLKIFEYQLPITNNKIATFEARVFPFSDENCIAAVRDISLLKETEKMLFDQQAFAYQVIDVSPFLVFVRDKHGRVIMLNQAAQHVFDHDRLAQTHLATVEEQNMPFIAGEHEVFNEACTIRFLDQITLVDGQQRWFEVTKTPFIHEQITYALVTAFDITHLVQTERALRKDQLSTHQNDLSIQADPKIFH